MNDNVCAMSREEHERVHSASYDLAPIHDYTAIAYLLVKGGKIEYMMPSTKKASEAFKRLTKVTHSLSTVLSWYHGTLYARDRCKNGRVWHLAMNAKKKRIKNKNIKRALN